MRFVALLLILCVVGCETASKDQAHYSALTPGPLIRGGLLGDAGRVGVAGPFTPLRGPVAVAAMGPDVYVADAGLGLLLRVDQVANRLTPFGPRGVQPGTRLAADVDGSLYVLDPASRRLQRFARDGRLLQSFPPIRPSPACAISRSTTRAAGSSAPTRSTANSSRSARSGRPPSCFRSTASRATR